jgi:hypothetical protein
MWYIRFLAELVFVVFVTFCCLLVSGAAIGLLIWVMYRTLMFLGM